MKVLYASCLALALLAPGFAATAATLRCDSCDESAYRSIAVSAGLGSHYVYDLPNARARKYDVSLECDENTNDGRTICAKTVSSSAVEAEIANAVLELAAYYQLTNGTMKSHFTIVADGPVQNSSAFLVAAPGGPRTQLFNWFDSTKAWSIDNTLPFLGASLHQLTVQALSFYNESLGLTLVTVKFSDGTEITLSYNMVNGTVDVVAGSAKDRFGNIIPATADQLNGLIFDYSGEGPNGPAMRRMQEHLSIFGAAFTGTSQRWSCVKVGGDQWNCTRI